MSALGQKRTCAMQNLMSALPPKADIASALAHVCFGPKADSCNAAKRVVVRSPRRAPHSRAFGKCSHSAIAEHHANYKKADRVVCGVTEKVQRICLEGTQSQ